MVHFKIKGQQKCDVHDLKKIKPSFLNFFVNQLTMKYCQKIGFKGYFFKMAEKSGDIDCPKL